MVTAPSLKDVLQDLVVEGALYERLPDKSVRCFACGHRCLIRNGREGICRVRFNRDGALYVPANYVAALHVDPVEKKPFYHALPGAPALTFGMLGCDFHCSYCQNWITSQALRDPRAVAPVQRIEAEDILHLARRSGARLVVSSYNEPLITSEWAMRIFRLARENGLITGYVSNGNGTPEVLDYIRPYTDLYKIDLKTFSDRHYRKLGGVLKNVLHTIEMVHERGFWMEIVTLVVPGFNDSEQELRQIARFLVSISPDIPWHVTAFHPDYKMTDPPPTPVQTIVRAAEIGYEEGLHFVYAGNLPGRVGRYENTYCPECGTLLVERYGFRVVQNRLESGTCPSCHRNIPGVWA